MSSGEKTNKVLTTIQKKPSEMSPEEIENFRINCAEQAVLHFRSKYALDEGQKPGEEDKIAQDWGFKNLQDLQDLIDKLRQRKNREEESSGEKENPKIEVYLIKSRAKQPSSLVTLEKSDWAMSAVTRAAEFLKTAYEQDRKISEMTYRIAGWFTCFYDKTSDLTDDEQIEAFIYLIAKRSGCKIEPHVFEQISGECKNKLKG